MRNAAELVAAASDPVLPFFLTEYNVGLGVPAADTNGAAAFVIRNAFLLVRLVLTLSSHYFPLSFPCSNVVRTRLSWPALIVFCTVSSCFSAGFAQNIIFDR